MASQADKDRLVDFLEKKAFRPVLNAKPDEYPENKRDKLRDVQRATESELERYRNYGSAEEVYRMYRNDLTSDAAERVHRELRNLDLPTLHDVREQFEQLAEDAGARS